MGLPAQGVNSPMTQRLWLLAQVRAGAVRGCWLSCVHCCQQVAGMGHWAILRWGEAEVWKLMELVLGVLVHLGPQKHTWTWHSCGCMRKPSPLPSLGSLPGA